MMLNISLKRWDGFVSFLMVMTVFFIPISLSLKSIFVVISLIAILLTSNQKQEFLFVLSQAWCKTALAFFFIVLIACSWSAADLHTCLKFIDKYSKLLFLPIFAIGFRHRNVRTMGIYAFLLAMLITCILSILKAIYDPGEYPLHDPGKVFHNHIITSYMMTFAAYLSGILTTRAKGYKRILLALLTLLFSYQVLFINTGRAGYIVYFILMIMLLVQSLPLKHILAAVLGFCALFALFSYQSNVLSDGIHEVAQDLHSYQNGKKETRVGYRLMFQQFAKELFLATPWKGQGTGGFSQAVLRDNFLPERKDLMDPHNQYWLVAAEFGLLGLSALFCFFASLLMAAFKLHEMKPIMLGLLVSFYIVNLSDSLLLYSAVGYFFILFGALCLGELVENKKTVPVTIDEGSRHHALIFNFSK